MNELECVTDGQFFFESLRIYFEFRSAHYHVKIRPFRHWQGFLGILWQVWVEKEWRLSE